MKKTISLIICIVMVLCFSVPAAAADVLGAMRPSGICPSGDGGFVITDLFNKQVLKGSAGSWTVIAGRIAPAGASGEPAPIYKDAAASEAYFTLPWAVVPFMDGYAVSDSDADVVRYVAGGIVQTLVTKQGGLKHPTGLATDGENLYISDTANDRIVVMAPNGALSVAASGTIGPTGLCFADGTLYVCETGRNRILSVKDGSVSVVAGIARADGSEYAGGYVNGPVSKAEFDHPVGIAADGGRLYVSDPGNLAIRVIENGRVTTLTESVPGSYTVEQPRGLAVAGGALYAADLMDPDITVIQLSDGFDAQSGGKQAVSYDAATASMIEEAHRCGIVRGYPGGAFAGEDLLTRAQFATILANMQHFMDGQVVIDGDRVFPDVAKDAWYAKAVNWAAAEGYILGRPADGGNIADPDSAITLAEMTLVLNRFASGQGLNESLRFGADGASADAPVKRVDAAAAAMSVLHALGY